MQFITYHLSKYSKITTTRVLCNSNDDEKALCSEKEKRRQNNFHRSVSGLNICQIFTKIAISYTNPFEDSILLKAKKKKGAYMEMYA